MKNFTLLILTLFLTVSGFAQSFYQDFETATNPASGTWTIGTQTWRIFDNGVGTTDWRTTIGSPYPAQQGTVAAFIARQNIGDAASSQDYLVTPSITLPANPQLRFFARSTFAGDQNTIYQIKVAPVATTPDPTVMAAYTLVQQWSENELSANFAVYEEKVVNLSYPPGTQLYIAFVKVFNQVGGGLSGDGWLVDDVKVVPECLVPTGLSVACLSTSASLSWNALGATEWEVHVLPAGSTFPPATGTPIITTNNTNFIVSATTAPTAGPMLPLTAYDYYVRAVCSDSDSQWAPLVTCTTQAAPPVCGGNYQDPGGSGNYAANSNSTITICPVNAGDQVTVTFTSFQTEQSYDGLYVYDGNSTASAPILSANGPGNGGLTAPGAFWGTTIPGPFTSTSADGCLTFHFISDGSVQQAGWNANVTCNPAPACPQPSALTTTAITDTSVLLGWTNVGPATAWEVFVQPCGSPAPTAASAWIPAPVNPHPLSGLNSATCYDFYVRAVCSSPSGVSLIAGPKPFTTLVAPPVCGGNFVDQGGLSANYANNSDSTVTICPVTLGDAVTVTFTAFNVQATNDGLYVFNGSTVAGTQISSGNPAGAVPGGLAGAYWGTAIPGPFTSSSADGCLTFRFRSNATTNAAGWIANVTCAPAPTCPAPFNVTATTVLATSATIAWTSPGPATAWEVIALPCGSPAPTAATVGTPAPTNPFVLTGLPPATCLNIYVRAVCSPTDLSTWSASTTTTTQIAPPVCGGTFVDAGGPANYPNNSNSVVTICPITSGEIVTVTFTAFNTENGWDGLYVHDGNSVTAPLIPSANGAGNGAVNVPGAYWGTTLPGPFEASSADGCLTFHFISDGSVNNPGWLANVTCAPPPTCPKPTALTTSDVTSNSVIFGWTNVGPATSWEVIAVPCGSPVPGPTAAWIPAPTNPTTITGLTPATCYDLYVRAICTSPDVSVPAGPKTITTQVAPPVCGGNFVDVGGISAPYPANSNSIVTICPVTTGDIVTVTFTSFATENSFDGLYVFDGNSITDPMIPSENGTGFGNVNVPGAYWGNTIPGPFTSTSIDGCLTFHFISDGSVQQAGWVANISCDPPPTCPKPNGLAAANTTQTSANLSWNQPANPDGDIATAWEILVLPDGAPEPTTPGVPTGNPFLATGLQPGTCYGYYVRAICSATDTSEWAGPFRFCTMPSNDDCIGALFVPVNSNSVCNQIASGTLGGTTASTPPIAPPCVGNADDDVWYQFIATNTYLNISLFNVDNGNTNLNHAVYTGACGALTQVYCSVANELSSTANNLTIGQTYYIRVYSNGTLPVETTFDLCVTTPSTCANSSTVCNTTYGNTTGVDSLGTIGCLGSSPNPTFFTIQILTSGPVNFFLTQTSPGSPVPDLDVDYAAWGPFSSQDLGCTAITNNQPPLTGQTTGCSFSAAPTETFNIPNAIAGTYYIILITNYSDDSGVISLTQTNAGAPGAGTTFCCSDAFFSYVPSVFCKDSNINPVALMGSNSVAGVFSASGTGLVFVDTATGEVDLAASAPGIYVITNTLAATSTCSVKTANYTIVITDPANATIAYTDAAYCTSDPVQNIAITGTATGSFSLSPTTPSGLSINPINGSFNPATSTPGIYTVVYTVSPVGGCPLFSTNTQVEILAAPVVVTPATASYCDQYVLPTLTTGNYFTGPQGTGNPMSAGDVIDTTQEIFVFADNGVCSDEDSFTITINSAVADDPTDVNQCTAYTLPALSPNNNYYDGPGGTGTLLNGTTFSAVGTYTVYVYAVDGACTAENVFTVTIGNITADVMTDITVCDSYALPALSPNNGYFSQTGGVGPLGATVDQSMTVYIYAQSGTCTDESSFVVTVNDTPVLAAVSPVTACDSYNLPALAVGNYFSSPGGVGPIGVVTASQLVYVYAQTGSTPNCFSEASFQVTINPSPVVADVADVVACESFTLEALASGGYFASPGGVNPITDMTLTQTQTVYVYEQSGTGTDICSDQDSFVVTITDAPAFTISGGCDGNVYVLEAIGTFGDDVVFQWETTEADQVINSGSNTAMATVSGDGIYNLTVSVVGNPDCFNMVGFPVNSTTCKIQKGISVDGDGHNDTFDLAGFNVSKLAIFNRYGSKVYERNNYVNEWFGQSDKGDELPDGTYYYVIERNTGESTTGWIYINRAN